MYLIFFSIFCHQMLGCDVCIGMCFVTIEGRMLFVSLLMVGKK